MRVAELRYFFPPSQYNSLGVSFHLKTLNIGITRNLLEVVESMIMGFKDVSSVHLWYSSTCRSQGLSSDDSRRVFLLRNPSKFTVERQTYPPITSKPASNDPSPSLTAMAKKMSLI